MLGQLIFYAVAALTVGSSLFVAFSRNIVHSTFALLGAFMGVVGIYVLLAADFVAMVQLLVVRRRHPGPDAVRRDAHAGNRRRDNLEPRGRHDSRAAGQRAGGHGDAVRGPPHAMASERRRAGRADHVWDRKRVPGYLRAALRDRLDGAAGGADRRGRDLARSGPGRQTAENARWQRRGSHCNISWY